MRLNIALTRLSACVFLLRAVGDVSAGARPQVDLSLSVDASPAYFVPGSSGLVTLTIHNAGPDEAGATLPDQSTINVFQDGFLVTDQPPSYEVVPPFEGCYVERVLVGPDVNGDTRLQFVYYVPAIPAGGSHVCAHSIQLDATTVESFVSGWTLFAPNDDDIDSSNDRVEHLFEVRGEASVVPVPTVSALGSGLLVLALGFLAIRRVRPLGTRPRTENL